MIFINSKIDFSGIVNTMGPLFLLNFFTLYYVCPVNVQIFVNTYRPMWTSSIWYKMKKKDN